MKINVTNEQARFLMMNNELFDFTSDADTQTKLSRHVGLNRVTVQVYNTQTYRTVGYASVDPNKYTLV